MRRWRKTAEGKVVDFPTTATEDRRLADGTSAREAATRQSSKTDRCDAALLEDRSFLVDFARFSEGILDERFLRRKYKFDNATWVRLAEGDELVSAIELEKERSWLKQWNGSTGSKPRWQPEMSRSRNRRSK
jgi:hypothetical protein